MPTTDTADSKITYITITREQALRMGQPTATTADGVTVKWRDKVYHHDNGKMSVILECPSNALHAQAVDAALDDVQPVSECYSRPCARLADGSSVAMVGDKVWNPGFGRDLDVSMDEKGLYAHGGCLVRGSLNGCYPNESRIMTPTELDAISAERDALRAELDEMRGKQVHAQSGEFQPFQQVLVRDDDNDEWMPDIFLYWCKNKHFPYVCAKSQPLQCVLYLHNEHLLGTTTSPDLPTPPAPRLEVRGIFCVLALLPDFP